MNRRTLLGTAGRSAAGLWLVGGLGGLVSACGGNTDETARTSGTTGATGTTGTSGVTDTTVGTSSTATAPASTISPSRLPATVKIGVIAPMSGLAKFLGDFTEPGVRSAAQHINDAQLLPGTTVEYEIVDAPAEEGAEAAVNAYNKLAADRAVIGIIWAASTGLSEAMAQITRDRMPVIATNIDLTPVGRLDPVAAPSVFQMTPPDLWLAEAMCEYAVGDRGYRTAGFLYDSTVFIMEGDVKAAEASGLEVVGIEEFNLFTADYGAQLQRLKGAAPECLFVYGLPDNTAAIVRGLADLDASYVDTPTARSGDGWHPHILGSPLGLTVKWAALAGDAAKTGTVSAWYLGGFMSAPEVAPISAWVPEYTGNKVTGGEEMAANAMWVLLQAAQVAGSTERDAIVEQLPGLRTTFATLPFEFDPETHLGLTRGDIALLTTERARAPEPTDPPYVLGLELGPELQPRDFVGLTHLVRPTLAANMAAQPEYMTWVLENGEGTQCTKAPPDALGVDVEMTNACKIH